MSDCKHLVVCTEYPDNVGCMECDKSMEDIIYDFQDEIAYKDQRIQELEEYIYYSLRDKNKGRDYPGDILNARYFSTKDKCPKNIQITIRKEWRRASERNN
jgi:hypothetical protein